MEGHKAVYILILIYGTYQRQYFISWYPESIVEHRGIDIYDSLTLPRNNFGDYSHCREERHSWNSSNDTGSKDNDSHELHAVCHYPFHHGCWLWASALDDGTNFGTGSQDALGEVPMKWRGSCCFDTLAWEDDAYCLGLGRLLYHCAAFRSTICNTTRVQSSVRLPLPEYTEILSR